MTDLEKLVVSKCLDSKGTTISSELLSYRGLENIGQLVKETPNSEKKTSRYLMFVITPFWLL